MLSTIRETAIFSSCERTFRDNETATESDEIFYGHMCVLKAPT